MRELTGTVVCLITNFDRSAAVNMLGKTSSYHCCITSLGQDIFPSCTAAPHPHDKHTTLVHNYVLRRLNTMLGGEATISPGEGVGGR